MLTKEQFNNLKKYDRIHIDNNMEEVMKYDWNDNMLKTKNKFGIVVGCYSSSFVEIEFDFLKKDRNSYFYRKECISILDASALYKPRKRTEEINN